MHFISQKLKFMFFLVFVCLHSSRQNKRPSASLPWFINIFLSRSIMFTSFDQIKVSSTAVLNISHRKSAQNDHIHIYCENWEFCFGDSLEKDVFIIFVRYLVDNRLLVRDGLSQISLWMPKIEKITNKVNSIYEFFLTLCSPWTENFLEHFAILTRLKNIV